MIQQPTRGLLAPTSFYRANLGSGGSGGAAQQWTIVSSGTNVRGLFIAGGMIWGQNAGSSNPLTNPVFMFQIPPHYVQPGLAFMVETQREPSGSYDALNIRHGTNYFMDSFGQYGQADAATYGGKFTVACTMGYVIL